MAEEYVPQQSWISRKFVRMGGGLLLSASLLSCSSPPYNDQASNRFVPNSRVTSEPTNDDELTGYEKKRQHLALELCNVLRDHASETTPWEPVLRLEDEYATLNKANGEPDRELMRVSNEYCPDEAGIYLQPRS